MKKTTVNRTSQSNVIMEITRIVRPKSEPRPQPGDIVYIDGEKYVVRNVSEEKDRWIVTVRKV